MTSSTERTPRRRPAVRRVHLEPHAFASVSRVDAPTTREPVDQLHTSSGDRVAPVLAHPWLHGAFVAHSDSHEALLAFERNERGRARVQDGVGDELGHKKATVFDRAVFDSPLDQCLADETPRPSGCRAMRRKLERRHELASY